MTYGFECPLCKKIIRSYSISSHLIKNHNYHNRTFDFHVHPSGVIVFIKRECDELEDSLSFKKVKLSKAYKKVFADKLHTTLDSIEGEEDVTK